jgi:hypothetical protein
VKNWENGNFVRTGEEKQKDKKRKKEDKKI